jgi:hypothetical protein
MAGTCGLLGSGLSRRTSGMLPEQTIAWDDVGSVVTVVRQLAKRPLTPGAAQVHPYMP